MGKKRRNRIILGIGLGILVAVIVAGYLPKGYFLSGFGGTHNHKTLWDWLNLAGVVAVPLVLAWFGFRLQLQQQQQTKEQLETERDIAEQNRQEEALQNYYDKVSALLVDKNLLAIAAKGDTAKPEERELLGVSIDVIRARTLATLQRLDGSRKASLIRFLIKAEVIKKLKLSLERADLSGVKLNGANLCGANLNHAKLKGAKLKVADLADASLYKANLSGADLRHACLSGTMLIDAKLKGAKLTSFDGADLSGTDLSGVDLSGVSFSQTILLGADLTNAEGLTKEQLEGKYPPFLCLTKLPESIDIDPNRNCELLNQEQL